ncbi:hypothetical protein LJC46_09750, partial [Desulfovibrio sp. OttesenSCG-928-G15]|nr:hypothetical protein [Desulfovibrio sp. OttesenSCG-928-G15]
MSTLGYHVAMNIKSDIDRFLEASGWSPYRLAKESGVNLNIIRRVQLGQRDGVHSSTLARLAPFIYGDKFPTTQEP